MNFEGTMRHFRSLKEGELSLIANKSHNRLLVMVETAEEANIYDTDPDEPGPADIFDNLHQKWNQTIEGSGINLAVLSYDNRMVREMEPDAVLRKIEKDVKRLADLMEIDGKDVGVMICSIEISNLCFKNGLDFINVLVANKSDKRPRKAFPLRLPFDSEFAYTNSVPTWMYIKAGASKDDGAGVNLLGFVVRAGYVLFHRQTEGSIYKRMRDYHRGKYGKLKIVQNLKQFDSMLAELKSKKYVSIDTETDNLNRINNTMLAIQFAAVKNRKDIPVMWVLPGEHSETPWVSKTLKIIKAKLRRFFEIEAKHQIHVYQNAKFDIHQFMSFLKIRWYSARIYDVSAGSFTLEENQKFMKPLKVSAYSLEHIERTMEYERPPELVIKKSDRGKMASFSMQEIADYGVIDVLTPLFIMFEQIAIAKNRGYPKFLTFMTRQMGVMIYVMTEMEHNGIAVDIEYLKEIASPIGPLAQRIRETANSLALTKAGQLANKMLLEKSSYQARGLFGRAKEPQLWNIRDNKHLQLLFFDILKLQPLAFKKDESGSLNAKFKKVYRHTPEVKVFTSYEKLMKLKSAFANAIYKYMINHPDMRHDHRLRPIFGYLGVLTGRSSTTSPSTQQIPTHGPDAKIIKKQFKVIKYRVQLKSDYGAHEVRVSGNITKDPAICNAVDQVNAAFMKFRLASTTEDILKAVSELVDLHCANYFTFFEVKIDKKDPRRQDAKAAVFAVTYGSMAKSIGDKMLTEALFALEDKLVKAANATEDKDKLSEKEVKKIKKEIRFMRSEEGQQFYFQKAKDLLEVLYKKWSVLTKFIEKEQGKAATNNVVFGPHGRPRHLWGYLHFDKFVHFAMNRRVFNSEGQGYASDYGYTSIYLAKKLNWELFERRGYHVDILKTNAVHDSSFNDLDFRFLPLAVYLQEASMIGETERYYYEHFGIKPTTDYGFDMEIGISEDDMIGWSGRYEGGKDNLVDIIRSIGPRTGYNDQVIESVVKDAQLLGKLRLEELRSKHPNRATLREQHIYDRIVPRLNCFKDISVNDNKKNKIQRKAA